jgi:hypothetical protein
MKNQMKILGFVLTLAAGIISSCEKKDIQSISPLTVERGQNSLLIDGYGSDESWNEFVSRVENGEIEDPLGQFVSNTTVFSSENNERPDRPKYSAEERNAILSEKLGSGEIEPTQVVYASRNYGYQFVSTEGVGLIGGGLFQNILVQDLKIVKDGRGALPGYYILNSNLNRGAGGQAIYLSFTRNFRGVFYASQEGNNPQRGAVSDITAVAQRVGAFFTSWPNEFVPTFCEWNCSGPIITKCYKEPDLNDGAFGRFIYAYQSKLPSRGAPIEVGVVSGNRNVQPPTGWERVGPDLNEGAGGAYIYFCRKRVW